MNIYYVKRNPALPKASWGDNVDCVVVCDNHEDVFSLVRELCSDAQWSLEEATGAYIEYIGHYEGYEKSPLVLVNNNVGS